MPRPSTEQVEEALSLYRAGSSPERIAERVEMDVDDVDRLVEDGWPARKGKNPKTEIPSLASRLEDRVIRLRNNELDYAQSIAATAASMVAARSKTIADTVAVEQALMGAWRAIVEAELERAAENREAPNLDTLAAPKDLLASLRTLRYQRDQGLDLKAVDLFRMLRGDEEESGGLSELESIVSDLAALTPEQQEEYARTGKIPKTQLDLPMTG